MFTIHHVLGFISYLCARNVQCWAGITKSNMEIQRYNRLKIVLAEKERTGYVALRADGPQHQYSFTLDDQQGTAIRGTARLCRLPEQELYEIARHLDVDVKELLISSK